MTPIAPLIEAFLDETLARQRGVSRHTRDSYALSFQLLFMFAAKRLKVSPSALTLEQLDAGLISAFLEYLEDKRKNAPVTAMSGWRPSSPSSASSNTGSRQPWSISAASWRSRSRRRIRPGPLSSEGRVAGRSRRSRSRHA
jgi:Site-specific recombinase XerD